MTEHFQIIILVLFTFLLPVDLIDSVITLVKECPKKEHDVIEASKRLGCGIDIYGNNQYMCVPNKNKTSLVEFCFQGVMGMVEKGNCLELSEGKLIHQSCSHFLDGCPETHFFDYEIYRYPACQSISTELQCYVREPYCTAKSNTDESSDQNNVTLIMIIVGAIVLITSCIGIILCYKRRQANGNKRKYGDKKVTDELKTHLTGNKDVSKVNIEQEIPLSGITSWKGKEIRIVLIGKTGSGKSATGNTILGMKLMSVSSVTSVCAQKSAIRFGHKIIVVDTPRIFDISKSNENFQKEIINCMSITSPGPHAFIFVLNSARFTEEERELMQHFEDTFGENIFRYCIVLFTRKDDLDYEGRTLDDHIKCVPPTLQTFIKKCGHRVIAFNNRLKGDESDEQVRELLSMISKNVEKNNGECYRIEMYEETAKLLQEREAEMRKKAQMERENELQAIKESVDKEFLLKNVEKHETKTAEEFQHWREKYFKNQEEQKKAYNEQDTPLSVIASKKMNEIRMVLLGKTGSGKSATGNTILGIKHFKSVLSVSSVTSVCAQKSAIRFGHKILIVDIPSIFDISKSNENLQKEIINCMSITSPGPHAFIFVLNSARFTEEERELMQHFVDTFGENIFRYCIVLFTRKDDLDYERRTLDDHIKCVPPTLQTFIKKCGQRVIAFNNRLEGDESDEQVRELLSMISKNVEKNNGECYRIEMYEETAKLLQEREAEMRKRAQMERQKELQRITNQIAEKYSKDVEKHKRELEFIEREKALKKQVEKEFKAKEEQLRTDLRKTLGTNFYFF